MSRTGFWSKVCRFESHEQSLLPPGMRLRCVLGNCPAGILLPMAEPLCSFTTAGSCADSFCLPHCAEIRNHFGGKQFLSGTHPMIGRSYVCVYVYIYIYIHIHILRDLHNNRCPITCMYTYIYIYICVCVYTYKYKWKYIYIERESFHCSGDSD